MFAKFLRFRSLAAFFAVLVIVGSALRAGEQPSASRVDFKRFGDAGQELGLVPRVLRAGGVDADKMQNTLASFAAFADRLESLNTVVGDSQERARAIFEFMHAEILRGKYDVAGSDLSVTLAGGPFNCATATALFLALAERFDLAAQAVSVVGHVWCRVTAGDEFFDVETTCPDWFAVAQRAKKQREVSTVWQEHVERAARARPLDERSFLAIFHYNRGVRFLRERQFSEAAAANLAAIELDPRCQPAHDNLRAALDESSRDSEKNGQTRAALRPIAER